ncbi:MAG TPA: lipopolysaccharide biosynthesis protein [Cyanobacteria bacterium UBA12227]|nr:lipopolysaccharide biosynthesis protein [Cyanobacteria bacterium UBA12227]HAX85992.1 lipopolysaccharide biosynthesis protein [Cyanobacteria bacterium UBA11370]
MQSTDSPDLDFYKLWLVIKRRWLVGGGVFVLMVGLTIPVALTQMQKGDYEAQGKLLFKVNRTTSLTGLGKEVGNFAPLTTDSNPISTEIEILSSLPLLDKTLNTLNLKDDQGEPISPESLQKKLKIKTIGATDVIEIIYKNKDAKTAAAVVNQLMKLYIENNLRNNRTELVTAQEFITKQLPKAEANVNQAEAAVQEFKERNQVVALDTEATTAVEVIAKLDEQIAQVQSDLKNINSQSAALRDKVGMDAQEAIAITSLNQSPGVQDILKEFQKVQADLTIQRTRFQEADPTIISLKQKEAALKSLLEERVGQTIGYDQFVATQNLQIGEFKNQLIKDFVNSEVNRLGLKSKLDQLTNSRLIYKQRLNTLPKLEKEQRELQRRLDAAQLTYQTLLQKLQELRLAENQNIGNARIVEPAQIPDSRSSGKSVLILLLGAMAGTLLAMATIIILEVRDNSIKTLKEVKDLFGYTLLATIPTFGKKTVSRFTAQERTIPELPVRDNPLAAISEVYRMLQANLKFLSSDKPPKVILVTSSVPQEGKSTVSANLALAIAQLGRRVLLVDADLRYPVQHHIWQLTNAAGLSDVLVVQAEFETAVNKVMDNLDVLTAGVIPPNPLALLDSKRMASLIEYFSEKYHFVIIDAPPLIIAADALTLGKMTDGVLLVARPKVVDAVSATTSKELLERSGQNVLGLVVNGVKLDNRSDQYFHYYSQGKLVKDKPFAPIQERLLQ